MDMSKKKTENDKIIIERLKDNPSMTIAKLAKVLNVSDKTSIVR